MVDAATDTRPIQVVWYKRDLRIDDHAPLDEAAKRGPVWPVYIVEPGLWQQPDMSLRHQRFIDDALVDLDAALRALGQGLAVIEGEAVAAFQTLLARWPNMTIHAHEETGNGWTYRRDQAVRRWARSVGVDVFEYPQFGVVRGLINRDHWAKGWTAIMRDQQRPRPQALPMIERLPPIRDPFVNAPAFDTTPAPQQQRGGMQAGRAILASFLNERGQHYRGGISSPNRAPTSASRLSAHIAYGTLSLRGIVQATHARQREVKASGELKWARSLAQFERRLHWHCHFIQKLEQQPRLETQNMHRGFDGMREDDFDEVKFEAWKRGQTGYPLVDACMRSLQATGWLTFRMRAMVTSFASYHLWLHWREPALHLARMFTDYEPGIHYNQIQMQSGTTGINATRIYNPVKQAQDQDPHGAFVRQWVPEWNTPDYPDPIVDHQDAARQAKARMKVFRDQAGFRQESQAVYQALGSRQRPARRKKKKAPAAKQGTLFD
jgi:deoxyribodipyrimidine photo-lyase